MPLQATSGAASYDAFGGGVAVVPNYIEDVFSTYLYTGTSASQTITNGIDLSTKGGLVWNKLRAGVGLSANHKLYDTARGVNKELYSNLNSTQGTKTDALNSFNTTGFTLGAQDINETGGTYVSWTFRKQPKFFDVVTYTGDGTSNRQISHSLGSVPGFIIVKSTTATWDWRCYHRSLGATKYIDLNLTAAAGTASTPWNDTTPTSTVFTVGSAGSNNASGGTYVAYLFAHDAGGFGLTGTDNVISCSSFTTDGSGYANITLGYEPQWIMVKKSGGTADSWLMVDNMRGFVSGAAVNTSDDARLSPNLSNAENTNDFGRPTATGFEFNVGVTNSDYIYIAIRRGPMKVPTLGTSVFKSFYTNATSGTAQTTNFPVDWQWGKPATGGANYEAPTRLLGVSTLPTYTSQPALFPNITAVASSGTGVSYNWTNTTFGMPDGFGGNQTALWAWRRAPSYFDVVAYTGTGSATTVTHNLGVVPELIIIKSRSSAQSWPVYNTTVGNTNRVFLNGNAAAGSTTDWNNTTPTSSVFSIGTGATVNGSAETYVAYLFATCAGVSKVGTYTGTGALQTVNCGFTSGARFILIRRTDSTGNWYIWDSVRGISSGNDPYFVISTADEVTGTNYVDTDTTGFKVTAAASTTVNISAATYIFLAIA